MARPSVGYGTTLAIAPHPVVSWLLPSESLSTSFSSKFPYCSAEPVTESEKEPVPQSQEAAVGQRVQLLLYQGAPWLISWP